MSCLHQGWDSSATCSEVEKYYRHLRYNQNSKIAPNKGGHPLPKQVNLRSVAGWHGGHLCCRFHCCYIWQVANTWPGFYFKKTSLWSGWSFLIQTGRHESQARKRWNEFKELTWKENSRKKGWKIREREGIKYEKDGVEIWEKDMVEPTRKTGWQIRERRGGNMRKWNGGNMRGGGMVAKQRNTLRSSPEGVTLVGRGWTV